MATPTTAVSRLHMGKRLRESEILASSLVNSVNQALGKLLDLWNAMGISKELQLERMEAAKLHIETLLNEMIDEESSLKNKIENDIEIQKNQLNVLRYQLGLDPYKVDDGLTILQLEKEYRLALDSALKEKEERLEKLTQLQREDQALCTELCVVPYYIPTGSIPNSTELEEIKEHITNLLKVKEQRLEEFHKLRREIRLYSKEIGHTPDGTLENNILCDDEEEGYICLTKKYLEDLQQFVNQLQKKKSSLMATKDVLMKQVQLLWDRLQWPQEKQERFTKMTNQCSICEATNMWEEELQTLEEVKKEKVKEIILKVRQDLESYWQKCFYSDEQKAAFQPFYDDNFSEELLYHHDEELIKIKEIYEEAMSLYDGVHKWEATLDRFIELEKKSTDPSRLLNRGGNLLKDERERSKTQKQLSKLGEELKEKIENWEKDHNSDFLIRSQRFLDYMTQQLQHYKLKKDQPKTSVKREEYTTPKGAMKRSAHVNTPTTNKIRKVASNLTVLKASSCSNITTNFAVPSKQPFQNKTPSKSTPLYSLHQPSLEECKKSKSASQPSYSDFLKEFAVKSSINNRILNSTLKENLEG
ncbi:PREDICTED: protein regulator of cytokinesis 1-like [Thamnophis sirtalis]|uniref:Protein regulator of cytokinesis 1-like n=1 Tax=Thamnophis sirtalis TaxID=35019 RepID=A0A6I9YF18_9SAUR|nr:PREDICTED: protein regulator of cytokinesis 1-like [Thamnophis sirtalis]